MLEETIPIELALRHCAGVVRQSGSADIVLAKSLIARSLGDDRDCISFDQFVLLLFNTMYWVDDDTSGLSDRRIATGTAMLAAHLVLGCATLEGAVLALRRLYGSTSVEFAMRHDGAETTLVVYGDGAPSASPVFAREELFIVLLFVTLTFFLGRPLPLLAHLTRDPTHPALAMGTQHWATFAPVELSTVAGLRIPRAMLRARAGTEGTDHICWKLLQPWFALADSRAIATTETLINIDNLRVDALAAAANVSPTTFRRYMTHSHGGFRAVRQKLLVEASLQLLRSSSRKVDAIATELGYADARSFRRFIKAATGKTPENLRTERPSSALQARAARSHIKALALGLNI